MAFDLRSAFQRRRVLVTGHSGFKGAWLSMWLLALGAEVSGVSLAPQAEPNLFDALGLPQRMSSRFVDLREPAAAVKVIAETEPEIVFHLAAQPLVRQSYADPLATFDTNIMGTANVLEACRLGADVRAVVCVTTDKVYLNREWEWPYRESDRLGGLDPYSASKACAELIAYVYRHNMRAGGRSPRVATVRGGNVVGGGDWSVDRIVPDLVRSSIDATAVKLRNPRAVRPWQHVLELCEGYLELGARLARGEPGIDDTWNLGPAASSAITVRELAETLLAILQASSLPVTVEEASVHEAQTLKLDISKALQHLDWRPRLDIAETLSWTGEWYRAFLDDPARAWAVTSDQIAEFERRRGFGKDSQPAAAP